MKIYLYISYLQRITQQNGITPLIHSVIQDTQQIMTGQFDLSGTCPDDAEPLPDLAADFTVITFQYDCILFGGRDTIKAKVLQQSGKVARMPVGRSLHTVNIRLCQLTFLLRRFSVRRISSLFFLIPSFGQRRVREDVSFPFLFFLGGCFLLQYPGILLQYRGFALQYPRFLQQHPGG